MHNTLDIYIKGSLCMYYLTHTHTWMGVRSSIVAREKNSVKRSEKSNNVGKWLKMRSWHLNTWQPSFLSSLPSFLRVTSDWKPTEEESENQGIKVIVLEKTFFFLSPTIWSLELLPPSGLYVATSVPFIWVTSKIVSISYYFALNHKNNGILLSQTFNFFL